MVCTGCAHIGRVATYADRIELAMCDLGPTASETNRIALRGADATTYTGRGHISNNRCHMRFHPRPTTSSVELVVGNDVVALDVP